MNAWEERLRTELRSESELIAPESIRPLNLSRIDGHRAAIRPARHGSRRRAWLVPVSAAAAVAVVIAGTVTLSRMVFGAGPKQNASAHLTRPGQFIAVRFAPKGRRSAGPDVFLEVAVSSVRTGAIMWRLLPAVRSDMTVDGLSLDRSGNLWITYSRGPVYQNNLAGGDPKPRSCANEIAILHASTGRVSVFLRTGSNVLIGGAAVSPGGGLLAYSESGCATGYFNNYLRITDLRTRRSWTIGRGLARCHLITSPAWTLDGRALLVGYAPHSGPPYTDPKAAAAESDQSAS